MERKLEIRSYQKLWKWNMKIYALSKDLPLPRAIPIKWGLCLLTGLGIAALFSRIPSFRQIPTALRYGALPFGIAKLLDSVKLDGKNPVLFFGGLLRFWLLEQGTRMEGFRRYEAKQESVRVCWRMGAPGMGDAWKHVQTIRMCWTGGTKGGNVFV